MRISNLRKNNTGASLVLVIVAMLFVGIISTIVLTMTVGNSRSTKATKDTSKNFYTSESALDDFEMYLKKLATGAATEAYASTLEELASGEEGLSLDGGFKYNFKKQFYYLMNGTIGFEDNAILPLYVTTDSDGMFVFDPDFVKEQISVGRAEVVGVRFKSIEWNYDPAKTDEENKANTDPVVFKGVEITLRDENGFETKITTDLIFNVEPPKTDWEDTSDEEFSVPIDHFVVVSGDGINSKILDEDNPEVRSSSFIKGTIKGNLYSYGDLNIKTKTVSTGATENDKVDIFADYIIARNNINVNGRLNIAPLANTKIAPIRKVTENDVERNIGVEVWCNNFRISGASDSIVTTSKVINPNNSSENLKTDIYLKGSLELNSSAANFTADGGRLYGTSGSAAATSYTGSSDTANPPASSAIVLNGLGAKLNLSAIDDLQIKGTAYTALPSLDGVDKLYNYYNGDSMEEPKSLSYYTQGESITFRSIQTLYLIPGEFINGVGHNPMKESEFKSASFSIDTEKAKDYVDGLLNSGIYKSHTVRYMQKSIDGTYAPENYVYLFWDFGNTSAATTYLNRIQNDDRYEALLGKQLSILGRNGGSIELPEDSDKIKTKGNIVEYQYDSSTKTGTFSANETTDTPDMNGLDYSSKFKGVVSQLNDKVSLSGNLVDYIFTGNSAGWELASKNFNKEMGFGPFTSDGNGETYIRNAALSQPSESMKYHLITGKNVQLGSLGGHTDGTEWTVEAAPDNSGNTTYIIITPGDVEINMTGKFRGMIIAGGTVNFADGLDMECLGMVARTPSSTGSEQVISEFQALLGIKTGVEEDVPAAPVHANNRLEAIFNVFNNSGGGGKKNTELVTITTSNWKRN